MSVRIQLKRSTASTWASVNPTLAQGEIGYETDTAKFKIGNGSTAWNSLGYSNANLGSASLDALSDVTITSVANGDFLRWNGSAWINDAVNLSTDTIGSYVESLVAGTGVTLSNNSGEGATPTVAIGQAVGTGDSPSFAGVTADAIKIGVTAAGEIDTTSGNLTIDSAGGTVTIDDDLVVSGNLTVSGTTTTLNTETLEVEDNIIVLNSGVTGSPATNAGVEIERGTSANVVFRWNESTDKWQVTENGTDYYDVTNSDSLEFRLAQEHWHKSVRLATNGVLPNTPSYTSGSLDSDGGYGIGATLESSSNARLVIDETDASNGERVLVKNQVNSVHNGIYIVTQQGSASTHWILTRASDMNGSYAGQVSTGELVTVFGGVNNHRQQFAITSTGSGVNGAHVLGTDIIIFVQFTGTASFIAGDGLSTSGNSLNISAASGGGGASRIVVNADSIDLGTVNQNDTTGEPTLSFVHTVTRDSYGRVTGVVTSNVQLTLGTNTTGDYVQSLTAGTGVTLTGNSGESSSPTISIGQAVGTTSNVTFASVTSSLTGNASTATTLQTPRNIAGQPFDGSANISIAPTDLTGVTATASEINTLDGITASTAELNILDGVTSSSAELNILDGATVSVAELNILDGATLSTTELNYVDGVTSAIQTQIDTKAPINSPTFTGTVTLPDDTVALGTKTTGNYVATITAGTGVSSSAATTGEGTTHTLSIGQAVATSDSPTFAGLNLNGNIVFEGSTANEFETTLSVTDPTADNTITIPDRSGTVITSGDTGTVTSTMIADSTIMDGDINASAAIDKTKISGTAITAADTGTVTSTMIADGTIVNGDINASAGIALSKLATSTAGNIIVYNSSGVPTSVAETGDVVISDDGVTSISSGVIVNDDINASAAIAHSKLANATAGQVLLGTTTTGVVTATTISGDITIDGAGVASIAANSVALGTDTTGDYVASLVAGTGVTLTNNSGENATPTVAIGQAVASTSDVNFATVTTTGNVSVGGDLTVTGSITTINQTSLAVEDPIIYLNDGSTVTNPDLGFAGNYNDGTYAHAGLFADASDGQKFKFFKGLTVEPTNPINTSHASYAAADVSANTFQSTVTTGTAPLTVASTTAVTNLNADLLDGQHGSYYAPIASPTFTGTVTLPTGTVTSTMIADGTITNTDINASAAIDKTKISGTAITAGDTGTVTSTMIADGTIVNGDINASAAIALSKLATSTAGNIIVYNSSGVPTSVAETGDVTISDTGVTAISSGVIVNADVNASAAIALSKLASGTSAQVVVANSSGVPTYTTLSGDVTISNTGVVSIAANSVALGTDTTGDYVASLVAGTGVTLTNNSGENATPTVAIGQAVGTTSNVQFANVTATGLLTVGTTSGAEGGEIQFLPASTGNTLSGNITMDINGNKLRIFEAGGSNRGVYIDLSTATAGVGTNLSNEVVTNAQTASYTLVLADKGKLVEMSVGSANNLTVPLNSSVAFPVGTEINILQTGSGQTTVVGTGGVTVNGTPGLKLRAQWSYATLIKRATDTWVLVGDISA